MNKLTFFIIPVIIYLFSSCTNMLKRAYGVKEIKSLNNDTIRKYVSENEILKEHVNYYVDSNYVDSICSEFGTDTVYAKYLYQPVQAMYFDTMGLLISYHVNCNAGGFPNLKWNRNNVFSTYPPVSQTACSSQVNYNFMKKYFREFNNANPFSQRKEKIVVFWSIMFYKQSRSLIANVLKNLKDNHKEDIVELQFVNTDYLYQ